MPPSTRGTEPAGNKRSLGLRGKLLLLTVPLVVIAFAVVSQVATRTARRGLEDIAKDNLELGAKNLADSIGQILRDTRADAITTARLDLPSQALDSDDPKNFIWYANELVRMKERYCAIVVADEKGRIVAANTLSRSGTKLKSPLRGRSIADLPWASAAYASHVDRGTWIPASRPSFLHDQLGDHQLVAGWSFPVLDIGDDRMGTVSFFMTLDYIGEVLSGFLKMTGEEVGSLAILGGETGSALALPTALPAPEAWRRVRFQTKRIGQLDTWTTSAGKPYLVLQTPVTRVGVETGWNLFAFKTESALNEPVDRMSRSLLFAFVLVLLLTVVALTYTSMRFVGPIERLTRATKEIQKASAHEAIPIETDDEVGQLTHAFNHMLAALKDHQLHLEDKVQTRTHELSVAKREVSDILDNMEQAIFTVNADAMVNREYSAYTKSVFGDVGIAGKQLLEFLQVTDGDREAHSRMNFWLSTVFGAGELQWALSRGDAVTELSYLRPGDVSSPGTSRAFELEYAPIYDGDGLVRKVMVIVKDVSDVKGLQEEVVKKTEENKENLRRASEVAAMDPDLFETFIAEAYQLLDEGDDAVAEMLGGSTTKESLNAVFRVMHTLKGNARIFKVTTVQNIAHDVETFFSELREEPRALGQDQIRAVDEEMRAVRALLEEFEQLGRQVLMGEVAAEQTDAGLTALFGSTRQISKEGRRIAKELARDSSVGIDADFIASVRRLKSEARRISWAGLVESARDLETALQGEATAAGVRELSMVLAETVTCGQQLADEVTACRSSEQYIAESESLLREVSRHLASWELSPRGSEAVNAMLRGMHSFKANARTYGFVSSQQTAGLCEENLAVIRDRGEPANHDDVVRTAALLKQLQQQFDDTRAMATAIHDKHSDVLQVFLGGAEPLVEAARSLAETWAQGALDAPPEELRRAVRNSRELARKFNLSHFQQTATALAERVEQGDAADVRTEVFAEANRLATLLESYREFGSELRALEEPERFLSNAAEMLQEIGSRARTWAADPGDREALRTLLESLATLGERLKVAHVHSVKGALDELGETLQFVVDEDAKLSEGDIARVTSIVAEHAGIFADASHFFIESKGPEGKAKSTGAITKIPQARILTLRKSYKELSRVLKAHSSLAPELHEGFDALGRSIQRLTMVPLSNLFERFRKVVFDLADELDKRMNDMAVEGEEMLVDVTLLDKMRDVLIHALRNCLDHGIEAAAERVAARKPERGSIAVRCYQEDGALHFDIRDDGRGIDPEAVKAVALSKGVADQDALAKMSDEQILRLLFEPGFSTAKQVTDVSGRGVGMDVIRSTMRALKGEAEIESEWGVGTTLRLWIPADYYQRL